MLDIAGVNAQIIYNSQKHEKNMDRLSFLFGLASDLVHDELNRLFACDRIASELGILIGSIPQKLVLEKGKPEQILQGKCKRC
jgi:hypothetical protein